MACNFVGFIIFCLSLNFQFTASYHRSFLSRNDKCPSFATDKCQTNPIISREKLPNQFSEFACRDKLWDLVNPDMLLRHQQLSALEYVYELGLWDLRAKCSMPSKASTSFLTAQQKVAVTTKSLSAFENSFSDGKGSPSEMVNIANALNMLSVSGGLYMAGLPNFPRIFVRDTMIAGMLFDDLDMLVAHLKFAAAKQGTSINPVTGEEVGKMFHEYPGFPIRGRFTDYNACDATALFILGVHKAVLLEMHQRQLKHQSESAVLTEFAPAVLAAVYDYILPHVDPASGMFFEDPSFADSQRFALMVTYWKDSKLFGTNHTFPVVYSLAHIQNHQAVKRAAELLQSRDLAGWADKMKQATLSLFDAERGLFWVAKNGLSGSSERVGHGAVSSDSLTALYFIDPADMPQGFASKIEKASESLETMIGYATETLVGVAREMQPVRYHLNTVWMFEQALIHAGAVKHGLTRAQEVSKRVEAVLLDKSGRFPELAKVQERDAESGQFTVRLLGCTPQLWSVAAAHYFIRQKA